MSLSTSWAQGPLLGGLLSAGAWPSEFNLKQAWQIDMSLGSSDQNLITHKIDFSIVIVRDQNAKSASWHKLEVINQVKLLNEIYSDSCGIAVGIVRVYELDTREEKYFSPELNYFDYSSAREVTDVSLVHLVRALPVLQRPLVLLTEDFRNGRGAHGVAYPKQRVSRADAALKSLESVVVIPYFRFHNKVDSQIKDVNLMTMAHEVTHVVYNCGHNSIPGNLMYNAIEGQGLNLNPQQCVRMKQYSGVQPLSSEMHSRDVGVRGVCIPDEMR